MQPGRPASQILGSYRPSQTVNYQPVALHSGRPARQGAVAPLPTASGPCEPRDTGDAYRALARLSALPGTPSPGPSPHTHAMRNATRLLVRRSPEGKLPAVARLEKGLEPGAVIWRAGQTRPRNWDRYHDRGRRPPATSLLSGRGAPPHPMHHQSEGQ